MLCRAMSAMLNYPDFRSYGCQWILCCTMRHFLCSNSVRVMLLKVWQDNRRDMSLSRNCVAVMLLKARGWLVPRQPRGSGNPFLVHFTRLFYPHVGSLRSPTWGFQKYNSYRVANMENETHITNTRLLRVQLVPSCKYGKRQHIL